jgi:hypothetical protein
MLGYVISGFLLSIPTAIILEILNEKYKSRWLIIATFLVLLFLFVFSIEGKDNILGFELPYIFSTFYLLEEKETQ